MGSYNPPLSSTLKFEPIFHSSSSSIVVSLLLFFVILFYNFFFALILVPVFLELMGIRSIVAPPPGLTVQQQHHHHLNSNPQNHHTFRALDISLIVVIPIIISLLLLVAVIILIALLRRLKSTKTTAHGNPTTSSSSRSNNYNNNNNNKNLPQVALRTSLDLGASPEVKRGCLQGANSSLLPSGKLKGRGIQVFTYKELELATEGFKEANVIGSGAYGVVYRATLSDGTVAAIKMLRKEARRGERGFRTEVDLLSRWRSPYLVEMLGYCADQNHRLLIFEFMPNGSLQNHIHPTGSQHQPLNWGTRLKIALDCARALEFLHEHAIPAVIHRNFKCSNVLLDHNFRARASNFGLAKMGPDKISGQLPTALGAAGYMAPEYASMGKLTTKSDVYSYGVVLLELLTGRTPVDTDRLPGEHFLVTWALPRLTNREKVIQMVDPALHGQYSKKELVQVAAIAAVCVQPEADYRPLMADVVQSLIPLVKSLSSTNPSTSSRFYSQILSPRC
ncbi:probable serine/threonine-protein kinase PBL7 isoform X2 [Telopea speciosissima]|uniref:probable serine/threonine-protein kinase PBL7 isoform X1 n=1 Tax=Telopea speciosissima TaxID=54955 RepID=UPI001CC6E552|nr:probable serine/threonine-protein kinase PBL7 isoform X1 [Telopea speciosissima]XP_043711718.1 probable serine/threonine-protein kinase PBL7 isoform X2 [Telopea speciosissima]